MFHFGNRTLVYSILKLRILVLFLRTQVKHLAYTHRHLDVTAQHQEDILSAYSTRDNIYTLHHPDELRDCSR